MARVNVKVYNPAGEYLVNFHLSYAEARAEVDRGNAHWRRRGQSIEMAQWDRCDPTPSGIPASTIYAAYVGGSRRARRKIEAWGAQNRSMYRSLTVS